MKSQGTIGIHISPILIYFPAYRGKAVIQTVREMPTNLVNSCRRHSPNSFLNVSSSTDTAPRQHETVGGWRRFERQIRFS